MLTSLSLSRFRRKVSPRSAPALRFHLGSVAFLVALSLFAIALPPRAFADPDAGLLFDDFELTLSPGHRTEAAGPLFYDEQVESRRTWAFPPLLSYTRDPELEMTEFDFAYPVLTYDRYGGQYRWQLFQLLSFAGGPTQAETKRDRVTLFPFYFQQRSSDTNENYTAVGPFYGHLKNRLFRDEIFFVMFPLYSQTRKRDVVTDNYLFPFFHLRHGDSLSGWQFWPLVGSEHKTVTTRTNRFDEVEVIGGHDRFFALWPIFYNTHGGIGTDNPMWQHGVLPLYALQRSPKRDSTTVLWPFFSKIDEREKNYREWQTPWPLVVMARGQGKTITRVLPFYSHSMSTNIHNDAYLWPIYRRSRITADPLDRDRTRILFFLYSNSIEKNTQTEASRRRVDLWPIFTRTRDFKGNTRLQILAPLEPFVPGSHKIERDYSPVWSLWRSEKNPNAATSSQSLLWNLYRRETGPDRKKVSALFGLFKFESGPGGKKLRLFYVPLHSSSRSAAPAADGAFSPLPR